MAHSASLALAFAHPTPWTLLHGEVRDAQGKPLAEFDARDPARELFWRGIVAAVNHMAFQAGLATFLSPASPAATPDPSRVAGADGPRQCKARASTSPVQHRSHA